MKQVCDGIQSVFNFNYKQGDGWKHSSILKRRQTKEINWELINQCKLKSTKERTQEIELKIYSKIQQKKVCGSIGLGNVLCFKAI